MRSIVFLSCVVGVASGCCGGPFTRYPAPVKSCSCTAAPAVPSAAPQQNAPPPRPVPPPAIPPAALPLQMLPPTTAHRLHPPTVREVREPEELIAVRAETTAASPEVVYVPRMVYVPYAPHPDERGSPREAQLTDALGQCLQQMKALNTRIADLEAKLAARPAAEKTPATSPLVPYGPISPVGAYPRGGSPTP